MDLTLFGGQYAGKRVLVTGHTGFKGSWLCLWLTHLGARVTALALPAERSPSHFDLLQLGIPSHQIDIRDFESLRKAVADVNPEVIFHLAAQSLVHRSYRQPVETWATNVMGTVNLLSSCTAAPALTAVVVVTTDKCYQNNEWVWGYREIDALGGRDPYSASKAGTELVASSFRDSFFSSPDSPLLATARAGNVIGGADWSEDRLIPDLVRAMDAGLSLEIRSPSATRPWQHVLDCLSGYLALGQKLIERKREFAQPWNFGPDVASNQTVEQLLLALRNYWPELVWNQPNEVRPHEAQLLYLDSGKARQRLDWRPVWALEEGIAATAKWYLAYHRDRQVITEEQFAAYIDQARESRVAWATSPIS